MASIKINFAGIGKKINTECNWDFLACPVLRLERSWAHEYSTTRLNENVVIRIGEFNSSEMARMNAAIAKNLCVNCCYKNKEKVR